MLSEEIFCITTAMMHFTIPETIERRDANGTPYTVSKKNVLSKFPVELRNRPHFVIITDS